MVNLNIRLLLTFGVKFNIFWQHGRFFRCCCLYFLFCNWATGGFTQLIGWKRTPSNIIETIVTSWSFCLKFLSTALQMRFLWLQSHQRDTWPGQNRWSWMCCSSPKVRGLSLWRPKKPLWRCRSAQISQAKRWLLRQKKGWSRTPPDTFPRERWAPCHSGPYIALCHIPGERREPAWQRVRDRLLAPWSEQESCANWS